MNFDNLRLFRDIAQSRSISKAAENHGITPSAVSQTVNEIERVFGAQLLDRSNRPLTLTREGRLFSDFCREVLRQWDTFDAALGELRNETDGSVRVAVIYSVGLSEMSQLEAEFSRRYPNARLEVEFLRPEKIYEAVSEDRVDVGLLSYPEPSKEIAVIPWREEQMALAAIPAHPLMNRDSIDPSDLNGVDFITFDDELPISREIGRYFRQHGVEVNTTMRFDNIQTIKEAMLLGSGVSILPERILRSELAAGRLKAVPLAKPGLYRPLGIIHRKKKRFHRAVQAFLDLLKEAPPVLNAEPALAAQR